MKTYLKHNSNFYHGDFHTVQLGGPEEWDKNEGGRPNWLVTEDMSYYIGPTAKKLLGLIDELNIKITMKEGFITDGGSFNNSLVPMVGSQTGRYFRAYALHDAIGRTDQFTFKESNIILDEALNLLGMPWSTRQRVFYPLKWFGSATKDPKLLENALSHVEFEFYKVKQ